MTPEPDVHKRWIDDLLQALQAHADADPARALTGLVAEGRATLPRPGRGDTLTRWQALAAVASQSLTLAKLYEGHTDALAVMAELGAPVPPAGSTWGLWAAEPPDARVLLNDVGGGAVMLDGTKAWCSGAAGLSHALLTTWAADGNGPYLAAVSLRQPGISFRKGNWQAVGMAASASIDVRFEQVPALRIGPRGAYLERPGFWQGGAGIAACWHGGACGIAAALKASTDPKAPWHRQRALGAIDASLGASAALLRETARWIDAHPQADAMAHALRVRAVAEAAAGEVLREAGRALGAAPFCRDAHFAALAADLPVYLRQSHGDRDLAALGQRVALQDVAGWTL